MTIPRRLLIPNNLLGIVAHVLFWPLLVAAVLASSMAVEFLDDRAKLEKHTISGRLLDCIDTPFQIFEEDGLHREWRIITLSNLSEALANISIAAPDTAEKNGRLLEKLVPIILDRRNSPYPKPLLSVQNYGEHGLYLSHTNIVLGAFKRLTGSDRYFELNKKISLHLANKSLSELGYTIKSYPPEDRWPADQAATLFSLYLYDRNYGQSVGAAPISKWVMYMQGEGRDVETGLHKSELTGRNPYRHTPRGSAMAWSVRYMSKFAPEEAKSLWEGYKSHFEINMMGMAGFREWPLGAQNFEDIDSGPIILDVGASATAFAVGASKAVGDGQTYGRLKATAYFVKGLINLIPLEELEYLENMVMAKAIELNNDTQIDWY